MYLYNHVQRDDDVEHFINTFWTSYLTKKDKMATCCAHPWYMYVVNDQEIECDGCNKTITL